MKKSLKNKKSTVKEITKQGYAEYALTSASDFVYDKVNRSALGRFFNSDDSLKKKTSESLILGSIRGAFRYVKDKLQKQPKRVVGTEGFGSSVGIYNEETLKRSFRKRVRSSFEHSFMARSFDRAVKTAASIPVMAYGLFLLALGISITAVQTGRMFVADRSVSVIVSLAQGILILLMSLPLMVNRDEKICDLVKSSILGRFIFTSVMGIDFARTEKADLKKNSFGLPMFFLGVLSGVMSLWYEVPWILVFYVLLICAIRVIYAPEFGLTAVLVAIPFFAFSEEFMTVTAVCMFYISLCFFAKVLVGKRSFGLKLVDFAVLMFALLNVLTSFNRNIGSDSTGALVMRLCFVSVYFVARSLTLSPEWIERAVNAFAFSSLIVSVFAIIGSVLKFEAFDIFTTEFFAIYIGASFLTVLARISFFEGYKLSLVPWLIIQLCALLACGAFAPIFVLLCIVLVFFVIRSRKTLGASLMLVLLVPFVSCFVAPRMLESVASYLTFSTQEQQIKLYTWSVCLDIFGDYPFQGIGLGDDAFKTMFSAYADSASVLPENAMSMPLQTALQVGVFGLLFFALSALLHAVSVLSSYRRREKDVKMSLTAVGIMCALLYIQITGAFTYAWALPALEALFWILMGISLSCCALSDQKSNMQYDYFDDVSTDVSIDF